MVMDILTALLTLARNADQATLATAFGFALTLWTTGAVIVYVEVTDKRAK